MSERNNDRLDAYSNGMKGSQNESGYRRLSIRKEIELSNVRARECESSSKAVHGAKMNGDLVALQAHTDDSNCIRLTMPQ